MSYVLLKHSLQTTKRSGLIKKKRRLIVLVKHKVKIKSTFFRRNLHGKIVLSNVVVMALSTLGLLILFLIVPEPKRAEETTLESQGNQTGFDDQTGFEDFEADFAEEKETESLMTGSYNSQKSIFDPWEASPEVCQARHINFNLSVVPLFCA